MKARNIKGNDELAERISSMEEITVDQLRKHTGMTYYSAKRWVRGCERFGMTKRMGKNKWIMIMSTGD
jgi:hypothetical protein